MTTSHLPGLLIQQRARSLEQSFRAFAESAWPVLEPATPFVPGRHIDAISEYLQAVSAGQIKRLIINVPPRMMKSSLASILWPCWEWAVDGASTRWLCTSYAGSLSVKLSVDRRTLLTSAWYQRLWPGVQLAADQNEKSQFSSTNRGHMLALSVGGTTTGRGGDFLIIDDPHSVAQAQSDAERASAIRYLRQTLMTRLDDPRTGKIVLIMQRLHELDATGELLKDGGWTHLCLPAIAEQRQVISLPSGRVLVREEGDLLEPQRLSQHTLDGLKKSMGSFAFAGQLMQQPAPAEGGLFKRSWWQRYTIAPLRLNPIVQSWDLAFKDLADSDFVVGQTWGFDGQLAYLLDQTRARMSYTATKQAIREMQTRWPKTSAVLIEDKANGSAVVNELKREISGLIAVEPEGGKMARAWACTPQVEAGQVYVPETPWADEFLLECSMFPAAAHDDMVDAFTQCLNWRRTHNFGVYANMLDDCVYDPVEMQQTNPGYGNAGWYDERKIVVAYGIALPTIFIEVATRGRDVFILREFYSNQRDTLLTDGQLIDALDQFARGKDPATGQQHLRSNDEDAAILLPDLESNINFRNTCWMKGLLVTLVSLDPEENITAIERVSSLFMNKRIRISNTCTHFISEHRDFRFDADKAASRGVEAPITDGKSQSIIAFRLFAARLNPWSQVLSWSE